MPDSNGRDGFTTRGLVTTLFAVAVLEIGAFQGLIWLGGVHARRETVEQIARCNGPQGDQCGVEGLKANVRAADAAEDAMGVAIAQTILNLAGLVGVGFTVFFAGKAWKAAQISANAATAALDHTRADAAEQAARFERQFKIAADAANAATKQANVAEDTAERQLRAYLAVNITKHPTIGEKLTSVGISVENVGNTPAYEYTNKVASGIGTFPEPNLAEWENITPMTETTDREIKSVLNPRSSAHINILCGMGGDNWPAVQEGLQYRLYVWGKISYKDAFGHRRFVKYRYELGGPEMMRLGVMHLSPEGNDSD